jgi:hypothetical protein
MCGGEGARLIAKREHCQTLGLVLAWVVTMDGQRDGTIGLCEVYANAGQGSES